ncbi:MAG: HAMP domain-containing histidine kinase [Nitrospirae bacterium]|nr:MAG: HAMP domain-containing histidine kinase [Nitrospirota bacterium]
MKTKIFLAFIAVILAALLSNFIFEWLIMRDFDNYVEGVRQDQFYWVLASVEGSHSEGKWDRGVLSEAIHWAMMLGLNVKVMDNSGKEVISSHEVQGSLPESMKLRMAEHFHIHAHEAEGKFTDYPLYAKGQRIGTLLSMPFQKQELKEKEAAFKRRTRNFLLVSFLIAGGGALLIAFFLSRFLSRPVMNLKRAAEKIAMGDFGARTEIASYDEVGNLAESFNRMAESLQKEEALRKRLFSNIAHELRTPLTILKTHAEAIADGVIDRGRGLENIKNEIDKLIKLVKGIEDVTAAEASFFEKGDITEINLREFLEGIYNDMLPAFREKGLDIKVSGVKDLIVFTDAEKLERIMRNLLLNSLKFTEKGGVSIENGADGKTFFIDIKDSGKGVSENELPLIFNRFYRGETITPSAPPLLKGDEGGLGLGLAIVKELVDVMGGRIEVKSKVGEGTFFRISFKIQPDIK